MIMCIQNLVLFCQFILKILSKNRILTSIKVSNSVANLQKAKINNISIDLVNDNVFKFGLILSIRSQDIIYNTNVDFVNDNGYTNFGLNRSIRFQDIEQKLNSNVNQGS